MSPPTEGSRAARALLGASLLGAVALWGCTSGAVRPAPSPTVAVRLAAFNDLHGYLDAPGTSILAPDPGKPGHQVPVKTGGVAQLAGAVKASLEASPNHLIVGAGDMVGASPLTSALFLDEPTIEALNLLGLDITSVGNHEFDRGVAELERKQAGGCEKTGPAEPCRAGHRFEGARFTYLAANVVDRARGVPIFPGSVVRRFDGVPVGFIGVTLVGTRDIVAPSGIASVEFRDEADTVNAAVAELRAQGVHAFVLLIHQGAEGVPRLDDTACPGLHGPLLPILDRLDADVAVVVSGHTHQPYVCTYKGFLVTSAASFARLFTTIDLELDRRSGTVIGKSAANHVVVSAAGPEVPGYPASPVDPAVAALVAQYDALAGPAGARPVGHIQGALRRLAPGAIEASLGDVVADAQLEATRASADARFALTNPGGLRTDLLPRDGGAVTYADVFAAQPFGNDLVTLTLNGAELRQLLEQQWSRHPGAPLFLQVSAGFHYAFDASRPVDGRVIPDSMTLDGVPVRPDQDYRMTVNSFLAEGGDGFTLLAHGRDKVVGSTDVDALAGYIAAHSPLPVPQGRRIEDRSASGR